MNPPTPPTQPSATPRTDAAYFAEGATMYSLAGEMKLVERELTAAQSMQSLACRKLDEAEKQLAEAKAECERLAKPCGWPHCEPAKADAAELARLRAELAAAQCPNVVCSKEGTQYCALAESSVAKLEAQLAAARKDSERVNLLATLLEDVNIGDIDPTKHRTEDNEWPDAWRDAIDAASAQK